MVLSERQRLVAETGLLTLLAWMALTIAIDTGPQTTGASQQAIRVESGTEAASTVPAGQEPQSAQSDSLPPSLALLNGLVKEPTVSLPQPPRSLPAGTVVRMGQGVHVHPEPAAPQPCLTRSTTGSSRHGPVP